MWRPCTIDEIKPGNFVQAATFDADINTVASAIGAEPEHDKEDTGPISVLHLVGTDGRGALLVSHKFGEPNSIEIRLTQYIENNKAALSGEDLQEVLKAVGISERECTWICPDVRPGVGPNSSFNPDVQARRST
jgi:hypothetical protein